MPPQLANGDNIDAVRGKNTWHLNYRSPQNKTPVVAYWRVWIL
jgi:hypothetical protein